MKDKAVKKRILLIKWGGINNWGGITVLLLNLLKHMDRDDLEIDLYVFGNITSDAIYGAFCEVGVHVIAGNHASYNGREVLKDLNTLIRKNRYDVVHSNTGGLSLTAITMLAAWLNHVPVRIAHSHNSKSNDAPYTRREKLYQRLNTSLSTARLACSYSAAEHIFGKKGAKKCSVLKNGIEPKKYQFRPDMRMQKRRELGLEDAFVVGHIGRFERQKNHEFLINVFAAIKKRCGCAALVLIGSGSLMHDVKAQTERLGLSDSVYFIGDTDCVSEYLQAMDMFVFPSQFEGLGIAAIEAQAADLPTICADTVPQEAAITSKCIFLSLNSPLERWVNQILEVNYSASARCDKSADIRKAGYDIVQSALRLHEIYLND